jgi:hypothetical protein
MNMGLNNEYLVHGGLAMTRGSVLRVEDGSDLLVYVWEGELWLTQERDGRDRHLAPGSWFRLDRDGLAVAQALSRSAVTITSPSPELYARRIELVRAGTEVPVVLYASEKAPQSMASRLRRWWAGLYAPHARPTTAGL